AEFEVIVPRGHPLTKIAKRSSVTLTELANFALVSWPHGSGTRRTIDAAASSTRVTLRHVATVSHFTTMISFVRAGVGIAIAPSSAAAGFLGKDLTVLKLIKPRISGNVGLIWLRERELTPAARGFAVILEEMWRHTGRLMQKKE